MIPPHFITVFKSVVPSTRLFKSELSHTCTLVVDFGDLITKIYQSHEAYVMRERRFWKDAVRVLSRWLEGGGRIRRQKEWLLYHIVNNDVGLHVLFDNLSVECESRWLETPDTRSAGEICNGSLRISDEKGSWRIGGTVPDRIHESRLEHAGSLQDKLLGGPKSSCNVTPKDLQSLPCSPCLRCSTSEDGPDRTVYPKGRSAQLRFFRSLIGILWA